MSDQPMDPALRREAGLLALDRAHRAARDLNGGELRRALEEAREVLDGAGVSGTAEKVAQALADLDEGPLDRAELLIEQARAELAPGRA